VDLEVDLGGSWWILTRILVDLGGYLNNLLRSAENFKNSKVFLVLSVPSWWILVDLEMDLDVGLGGSWWILKWILVDLEMDLGGS
jgi:hypothetical protein